MFCICSRNDCGSLRRLKGRLLSKPLLSIEMKTTVKGTDVLILHFVLFHLVEHFHTLYKLLLFKHQDRIIRKCAVLICIKQWGGGRNSWVGLNCLNILQMAMPKLII